MGRKFRFYAIKICLVLFLVFVLQIFVKGFTEIFLLNENAFFQYWRFLTSIFLHGGIAHLFYNVFALVLFGSILESLIGGKKFLRVFFVTGILANLVSVNFYDASLGASGAIFGVIGALIVVRPLLVVWAFGLPMPIFVAGILWVAGDFIGIFNPTNVANIAHLSGMFFGLIFGALYRKPTKKKRNKLVVNERDVRNWEKWHFRR
jgi:uncharacterized protein